MTRTVLGSLVLVLLTVSCADTTFSEEHWRQLSQSGLKVFERKYNSGLQATLVLRGSESPAKPNVSLDVDGFYEEKGGPDGTATTFLRGQMDLVNQRFQFSGFRPTDKNPTLIFKGALTSNNRLEGTWADISRPDNQTSFSLTEKTVTDKDQLSAQITQLARNHPALAAQGTSNLTSSQPAPQPPQNLQGQADSQIEAYIRSKVSNCQGRNFSEHSVRSIPGTEIYEFDNFAWKIDDQSNTITQLGRLNGLEFTATVHITYTACRKLDAQRRWAAWSGICPPLAFEIKKQNGKWTIDDNDANRGVVYSKADCNKLPL
jgi:hypothetical protein